MLDLSQERDARVDQRPHSGRFIWFGTVRPFWQTQLVPVWFA